MLPGSRSDHYRRSFADIPLRGAILCCLTLAGCGRYHEVESAEALTVIKALYTACATKNAERLEAVKGRITEGVQGGVITPYEARQFGTIIGRAESGDWERAAKAAYRYARDQVR